MQAILTHRLSQTNHKPARVAVTSQAARRVYSADMFDVSESTGPNGGPGSVEHQAALAFIWEMGLHWLTDGSELVSATLPSGDGCHVTRTGTWRDKA